MDFHNAFHKVQVLNQKILEIKLQEEKAMTPEIKQAFSTIQTHYTQELKTAHLDLTLHYSTIVANLPK
jgi:hypothetical protein